MPEREGFTPDFVGSEPAELSPEKGPDQPYGEKATVNGIDLHVGWDQGNDSYTIYFPQIKLGKAASEQGIYDQIVVIGSKPEAAKQVFDYATKVVAEEGRQLWQVYQMVELFVRDLPDEE